MPVSPTPVTPDFYWRTTPAGRVLVSRGLEPFAPHLFTCADRSFARGSQDAGYAELAADFGVQDDEVVRVRQVHGRDVLVVHDGQFAGQPGASAADAIVSFERRYVLSVRVADCVPVLVAGRSGRVVAAIHAGWRGTAAGASSSAVAAMTALGVPASDLVAAIGPSIGACCYQVDEVVKRGFEEEQADAGRWFEADGPGFWRLDLQRANREQLEAAGVPAVSIAVAACCTFHDRAWHSFRRDGAAAGRMVAAVGFAPLGSGATGIRT